MKDNKLARMAVEVCAMVATPVVLLACALLRVRSSAGLTMLVVVVSLVMMFVGFETSRPTLRQILPTAVLAAIGAVGRIAFAALADVKPLSAVAIVAGASLGRRSGFVVGALAALVSNVFFGQGPWTPWQMYAWGLVGYLGGVLAERGVFERHASLVLVYGLLSGILYGFILNSWHVIGFVHPLNWHTALLAYGAGAPLDVVHGVATAVFLALIYVPWRRAIERVVAKYGLGG